jgi:hypothetical protein
MSSNPHPHEVGTVFHGKCAIVETYTGRPTIAELLELQGRVTAILFEKLEVLAGQSLYVLGERIESLPELRRRSMHLKVSQLPLLLRCLSFIPQKIQFACRRVSLDLPVPNLPISLGNPVPKPYKVFARKGLNFGLDRFNLRHACSTR